MKRYHKIKISTFLIGLFLIFTSNVFSQEDEYVRDDSKNNETKLSDRFFFGGSFGFQFGTVTNIDVSPTVGFRFTNRLSAGIGATYQYYKNNYYNISASIYGGSVFSRFVVLKNIFLQAEFEQLNVEDIYNYDKRIWVTNVFGGAGYRQQMGERAYIYMIILYNFNHSIQSPYDNPKIKIGINF